MAKDNIKHVFVLMLENRSFDQMLGFSGIPGIDGLSAQSKLNVDPSDGVPVYAQTVNPPAYQLSPNEKDPGYELFNTFRQLTGQKIADNTFPQSGYQNVPINNQGFVMDYARYKKSAAPEKIMYCFSPEQIPVINTLAKHFAVCDCWFSSMPGPALPNYFFTHAGTSGGLDDSTGLFAQENSFRPVTFTNGTIYKRIQDKAKTANNQDMEWHVYKDGFFALSTLLADVRRYPENVHELSQLGENLKNYTNKRTYNFIEPDYSIISNYKNGNSQHPYGNVLAGEMLIKKVYETIRANEDVWKNSLLVVLHGEHGGFYDHVSPPTAFPTDDTSPELTNKLGFKFDRYGIRVPAVFISPWIKPGTVIKEVGPPRQLKKHYDHTSIIRSLCELWDLNSLTPRDANAQSFLHIIGDQYRDVPKDLLANSTTYISPSPTLEDALATTSGQPDDNESIDAMLTTFIRVAVMDDLEKEGVKPEQWSTEAAQIVATITSKLQARQFLKFVEDKSNAVNA